MRVGLYNLEGAIINTALMQVSAYHKALGDRVEFYNHLTPEVYGKVYAFSIFDFTSKVYVRPFMICGGSGFDIYSRLPQPIEAAPYDWDVYPNCDFSLIWFSRGCLRRCPFCIVWKKEGFIKSVEPKNLNPRGKYVKVMDNNFFGNPLWRSAIAQLKEWGQPVDFTQGIDIRIFTEEQAEALKSLRLKRRVHIAWDNPKEDLIPILKKAVQWFKARNFMCYVLIGYDSTPEQDLHRVQELKKIGIDPFIMPFNKVDKYQRRFARWVNHKAIFKSVSWEEYKK